ncbi:hypothetical protein EPI10_023777 [Gossypium australe]|uniref:Uncharacterized protein n=1 Tax=Gossypium australe TaxID=47621 RepID=A0A5B6VV74_9ROSI|nr:hypothetical protein EPI10_023777 [Gossypium australe]
MRKQYPNLFTVVINRSSYFYHLFELRLMSRLSLRCVSVHALLRVTTSLENSLKFVHTGRHTGMCLVRV